MFTWDQVDKTGDCWLWLGPTNGAGYGSATHPQTGREESLVQRIVYKLEKGPIPKGLVVRHTCDTKLCCRPTHLILGTQADNVNDARIQGHLRGGAKYQVGDANNNAIVLEEQARAVLYLYNMEGMRQTDIAKETGVKRANVWAIVHRQSWTHLPETGWPP